MVEREKTREELHAQRQDFIQKAIQERAHEKRPEDISQHHWERAVNIGVAYNFGDEYLEVLGLQYERTKEIASKAVRKFIEGLLGNSSEGLRFSHPLEDLLSKRPESEIIGERRSQAMGGISLRVREQVRKGAKDVEEIQRNTGISESSIRKSLGVIRRWGIDVSRFIPSHEDQEKIEQLTKEEDDKKIQQILDELPPNIILANLVKRKLGYNAKRDGLFITVGDLTSGVFHYSSEATRLFFDSLRLSGISSRPVECRVPKTGEVQVHYYVLLERHRERALGVLDEDPSLQKYKENPVKIICGKGNDPIPSTHQLQHSGDFRSVESLFKEMKVLISKRRSGFHYSDFLTPECRVPVYQYQHGSRINYYFPEKYAAALKNFLTNRYAALFRTRVIDVSFESV
ncbi:MAG: hypothetical protein A2958_02115 [Candidatus Levybacteria bacterium RIFCSPLOWO2_01_FULL_38_13]|nr:MAG: hypothetical protein A2629_02870 [Candidatus Levybacteria bacterium RIFCSPHIGHO2_01_FULL_41_15]OGH35746.1 MAG: hypothetical protein A2958_02115 [Candidatus Levybacteria bacterium RIFCSPLOWO2_01_FULL_38_13]